MTKSNGDICEGLCSSWVLQNNMFPLT
uniref:Uncharacterized protein n=1 Tax=Arundo donax TaxID=35708 RepID=A0A0A8Y0E7_ARUDO